MESCSKYRNNKLCIKFRDQGSRRSRQILTVAIEGQGTSVFMLLWVIDSKKVIGFPENISKEIKLEISHFSSEITASIAGVSL